MPNDFREAVKSIAMWGVATAVLILFLITLSIL